MSERERDRLRVALALISGRRRPGDMSTDDWEAFGYDRYALREHGLPSDDGLLLRAEETVEELLVRALARDEETP